jgi:hypothetical protein
MDPIVKQSAQEQPPLPGNLLVADAGAVGALGVKLVDKQ